MSDSICILPFLLMGILGAVQMTVFQEPIAELPVCALSTQIQLENPLRIGAWNMQALGRSKMRKADVMDIILKVMLRYDIIIIQEIVDYKQKVPYKLLKQLNEAAFFTEFGFGFSFLSEPVPEVYGIVLSKRLGGKKYKEQYAFYYRKDKVILNATFQYPDSERAFTYEPFVAVFETPSAKVERVALVPIHVSPRHAKREIDALVDVYDSVVQRLRIDDAIILGDFNAGCSYFNGGKWKTVGLRMDQRFNWLISDHADTTTKGTTCPYDRIVVAGSLLKEALYEETAKPFYFDEELNIVDRNFVEDVSDHYPVEILLKGRTTPSLETQTKVEVGVSVTVKSTLSAVQWLEENCLDVFTMVQQQTTEDLRCGRDPNVLNAGPGILLIEFYSANVSEAFNLLDLLNYKHSCVLTTEALSILKYKLSHGVLKDPSLYGEDSLGGVVRTQLLCLKEICSVFMTKETPVV